MKREVFVVAGAIIKDNKVFSAQRGNKGETKYKWEFPGGKIEKNETPEQALKREFKEELNVDIEVHELITSIVDEYETIRILSAYFLNIALNASSAPSLVEKGVG